MSVEWFDRQGRPLGMLEAAKLLESGQNKIVAQTTLWHGAFVSTVWLGLNHRMWGKGPPLIFETMVFAPGSRCDLDMARYSTEAEARAGHAEMLRRWRWRAWATWSGYVGEQWRRLRQWARGFGRVRWAGAYLGFGREPLYPHDRHDESYIVYGGWWSITWRSAWRRLQDWQAKVKGERHADLEG